MDATEFEQLTGDAPENDDLERVNCNLAGTLGHDSCGICPDCGYPNFIPKFEGQTLICRHPKSHNHEPNA